MTTPTSKGVLIKPRRAWGDDSLGGAAINMVPAAGQFQYAALFNNSNPSVDLAVYALSLFQTTNFSHVNVAWLKGILPGAALWSASNPVRAGNATPPGQLWTLASASVFGTIIFEFGGPQNWFLLSQETPILLIPPGYSMVLSPAAAGDRLVASILWAIK